MSKIGDRLQRLHKASKPIGFGFGAAVASPRRMLLVVCLNSDLNDDQLQAVLQPADAVVLAVDATLDDSAVRRALSQRDDTPVGVWAGHGEAPSGSLETVPLDFFVCGVDGPVDVVAQKEKGCLVVVEAGLEASRLRAIAELGIDAVVMKANSLDLTRISAVVECRRIHSVSGKPVVLQIDGAIETRQIVALSRAGVDALMVNSDVGAEAIAAVFETMSSAPYESRLAEGGSFVAIGSRMNTFDAGEVHEDDEGDGDEDGDE